MMGRFLALAIILAVLLACSESADVPPDGDDDDRCTPGERICEGGKVLRCGTNGFELFGDCEEPEVCHMGACVRPGAPRFERRYLPLSDAQDIEFDFSDAGASYLLALYSTRRASGAGGYSIEYGSGCVADATPTPLPEAGSHTADSHLAIWRGKAVRLDRIQARRLADRERWQLLRHLPLPVPTQRVKTGGCLRSDQCPDDSLCENGHCLRDIPLYFDAWQIHTDLVARVAAKGERCAILVDREDEELLSPDAALRLLDSCDRLIVPRAQALFGEPIFTLDGEALDLSDRNQDGLLHVLLSSKVNEEGVWGFFNSGDFWPNDDGTSNERDIIYVALPESDEELGSIEATIIHEYQHLLHFVIHNWGPKALGFDRDYNPVWLDEALAHLAEELAGFGVDNLKLVADALEAFGSIALTTGADSLKRRGMGMMLMLYLFEQAGGVAYEPDGSLRDLGGALLLRSILQDVGTGMDSLERVVGQPFRDFYADWLTTLVASESPVAPGDPFRYQMIRRDPVTDMEIGLVTHGERSDALGQPHTFNGPKRLSFSAPCLEGLLRGGGAQYVRFDNPGREARVRLRVDADDDDSHVLVIRLR